MIIRRSTLSSPKFARQKRKKRWYRLVLYIVFVLVLIGGASYYASLPGLRIQAVVAKGNTNTLSSDIETFVKERLTGSYFWLFPKNSFLLYPKGHVSDSIFDEWPSMKKVDLALEGKTVLVVTVEERTPSYVWCGTAKDFPELGVFTKPQECFYADETGYLYSPAAKFSGDVYVRLFGERSDESRPAEPLRSRYLTLLVFEKIMNFAERLEKHIGSKISYVVSKGNEQYEIGYDRGVRVLFTPNVDLMKAEENLQLFLEKGGLAGVGLEYKHFDLRYRDKVYFR